MESGTVSGLPYVDHLVAPDYPLRKLATIAGRREVEESHPVVCAPISILWNWRGESRSLKRGLLAEVQC